MAAVNVELVRSLTELWRARADATVTVDSGRIRRTLHIQKGELIGADSDVQTERLGVRLVADGALAAELVEPMVTAARAAGRYFGDVLVSERLLTGEQVGAALLAQALSRFDRALVMDGEVRQAPLATVRVVTRRALGPELVRAFRERLPVMAATGLVAQLVPRFDRMGEDLLAADGLELTGPELRCFRQLASGQGAAAVLDRAADYEGAMRFIGALVAMGAVGVEQADPVLAYVRSA